MESFSPESLLCRLKEKSRCRFRKDRRDPAISSVRRRKRFPDLAEARESLLFPQEQSMHARVWFRHESDRDPETDRDRQNRTAQDRRAAGGHVGSAVCPSSASRAHEGASRHDRRRVRRRAVNNAKPYEADFTIYYDLGREKFAKQTDEP